MAVHPMHGYGASRGSGEAWAENLCEPVHRSGQAIWNLLSLPVASDDVVTLLEAPAYMGHLWHFARE